MTSSPPFEIETISWDDLSDVQRDFFCFKDDYLPLPQEHALQIHRLTSESAQRVWKWLGPSLPPGWPESEPKFPNQTDLLLDEGNWNTVDGLRAARQWLHDRGVPYSNEVYLIYESNNIIRMPWKLVVKYWDAFAWSVGYAKIAMDCTRQWACCFHHENWLVFGTYSENAG